MSISNSRSIPLMCSIYVQHGAFFCDLMLFKKAKVKLAASFNSFRKNTSKDKEFPFNYHELSEFLCWSWQKVIQDYQKHFIKVIKDVIFTKNISCSKSESSFKSISPFLSKLIYLVKHRHLELKKIMFRPPKAIFKQFDLL